MGTIIDFFKGLIDVISFVVDFVIKLFNDLVYIIKLLGNFIVNIPSYFGWLPTTVVTLIVTIFTIAMIYKIAGREG